MSGWSASPAAHAQPMPQSRSQSALPPFLWPISLADTAGDGRRRWIQVAKTGKFFSSRYGNFEIAAGDLQQMLTNFLTVTPIAPTQLPIDYDHLSMDPKQPGDGKAAGWFVPGSMELRDNGQSLWAEVEFTEAGHDAVSKQEYRFISPSFVKDYVWKNGQNIGTTLIAAAITNHPFLEGMAAITMSMNLGDVATAAVAVPPTSAGVTALAEVGQRITLQPQVLQPGQDPAAIYEVTEVAGTGESQFVRVKDAAGLLMWFPVSALAPAPAVAAPPVTPNPQASTPPPSSTTMRRPAMDVFKLRDSRGQEIDVKAEDVTQFVADQIAAARTVPEGSVVITASQLTEFQKTTTDVVSLTTRVAAAEAEAKEAKKAAHVVKLTSDLDALSKAMKITKPQRDYALRLFADPGTESAYDEWKAANVSATPLANAVERGSGAGAEAAGQSAAAELHTLALARSKDRGVSLAEAVNQITAERPELATEHRRMINEKAGQAERIVH